MTPERIREIRETIKKWGRSNITDAAFAAAALHAVTELLAEREEREREIERLEGALETATKTLVVIYEEFPDVRRAIILAAEKGKR